MNRIKKTAFIAAALVALGANVGGAHAANNTGATGPRDPYTDGGNAMGKRDPYTDGAKAGKFEIYSDGAWKGDTRYPSTDGSAPS